jgi:hypothetical protein
LCLYRAAFLVVRESYLADLQRTTLHEIRAPRYP